MMKATEALELHADLIAKVSDVRVKSVMSSHLVMDSGGSTPAREAESKRIIENLEFTVKNCETFFVAEDMTDLITHSANMLDASDLADRKLAPTRSGFAYFEKPIPITDVRGETLLVNVLVWQPVGGGLLVHMWNDQRRNPDYAARTFETLPEEFRRAVGRWGYIGIGDYRDDQMIGSPEQVASEEMVARYEEIGITPVPYSNPLRVFHAFILLMQQKLVRSSRFMGDRKQVRRMMRMGLPGEVTVIQLRHIEYPEGTGESEVYWRHRWIVRGFWRWQPYKEENGEWARKRIWIDPYIKGPAGAPLKITKKVNAVVR